MNTVGLDIIKDSSLTVKRLATLSFFNFRIHRIKLDAPERLESIDNCTKKEVRPLHKHLTPAIVYMNKCWRYDHPEAQNAKEE